MLEIVKSDLKEVFVPFDEIGEVVYVKSWFFGDSVNIKLTSLKSAQNAPFLDETNLVLELDRKQRENGKNFAVDSQLELSNYRNEQLDKL
jgi:hypothetical protein